MGGEKHKMRVQIAGTKNEVEQLRNLLAGLHYIEYSVIDQNPAPIEAELRQVRRNYPRTWAAITQAICPDELGVEWDECAGDLDDNVAMPGCCRDCWNRAIGGEYE